MIVKVRNEETFSIYECDYVKYGTFPIIHRNGGDTSDNLFVNEYSEFHQDEKNYGFSVACYNAAVTWVAKSILEDYTSYSVHDNIKRIGGPEAYSYIILYDDAHEKADTPEILIYNGEAYLMNKDGKTIENISDHRYGWTDLAA